MREEFERLLHSKNRNQLPKILLVGAEAAPLAKTGGLAEVIGALPKALKNLDCDARVMIPCHRVIKDNYREALSHFCDFTMSFDGRSDEYVGVERLNVAGVSFYLIDNERWFGDSIYRGGEAEGMQYSFFCRAFLEALPKLDFIPDIVHCNDWQTAMIPMLAKTQYTYSLQGNLKYVFSIHNILFQGRYSFNFVRWALDVDPGYFTPDCMELYGSACYMKAGILYADRITTVSPTYAKEILTPEYSEQLDGVLRTRSHDISGIINGIDTVIYNPAKDKYLPVTYSRHDASGKVECKRALQERLGLSVSSDTPIIAMITRISEQKGFALIEQVIDDIMLHNDLQFIVLGTGDSYFEKFLQGAQKRYPGRLSANITYNDELAHLVYAGSDMVLMPSRFEPCGLSQMIAMRYGTVPIVRKTGGLKDSVSFYSEIGDSATGFGFDNFSAEEMKSCIIRALDVYRNKEIFEELKNNALHADFSFNNSAEAYLRIYLYMIPPIVNSIVAEYDCNCHDYHYPVGAIKTGEELTISFKVLCESPDYAFLRIYQDNCDPVEYPMINQGDIFTITLPGFTKAQALWYNFRLVKGESTFWLCPDETQLRGRIYDYSVGSFRQTVYLADFKTPSWFKKAVMYQIFPDRFARSNDDTAKKGIAYHQSLGQRPEYHESIFDVPRWYPREGEKDYFPDDFYGGTFKGIQGRLTYLKELGISCVYLNPVVEARSNHRYDTSDYTRPDPVLGTIQDFEELCSAALEMGIRIIIDGVYSHTGSDSIYFNRYGNYDGRGACQGMKSDYYDWFDFTEFPNEYRAWWGIKDLPEVDETNPMWQNFIINGENSIVKSWLRHGASGWRLDVADELPDEVLNLIRIATKSVDPECLVMGEVWEDVVTHISYNKRREYGLGYSLDSVMNYPFRIAMLDFMHKRKNAFQLRDFFVSQKLNYPRPLYYSLMNLVGSHDTDRIRTALSTDVFLRPLPRETQMAMVFPQWALDNAIVMEKLTAVFQFTLPGVPSVYYGDEQGMCGVNDPFNRQFFKEGDRDLHDFYAKLGNIRNTYDCLSTGEVRFVPLTDDVIGILRYITDGKDVFGNDAKNSVLFAVINRGIQGNSFAADIRKAGIKESPVTPLLGNGFDAYVEGGILKAAISAQSAEIFVIKE